MKKNITSINGGKRKHNEVEEGAYIVIDGERFDLDSFVLSGEGKQGKRILFTYNCSMDELMTYTKVLEIIVNDKVREALND